MVLLIAKKNKPYINMLNSFINNCFHFLAFMFLVLTVITLTWLISCGFLLDLPILSNFSLDMLLFTFGAVWALFASPWALLYILTPNITSYDSLLQLLQIYFNAAPFLCTLHIIFCVALVIWLYSFFKGLMNYTTGRTKANIKIMAVVVFALLIVAIILLLFGDVLISNCAPLVDPCTRANTGWFAWLSSSEVQPLSQLEAQTHITKIAQYATQEASMVCRNFKTEPEAKACWQIYDILQNSLNNIQLDIVKMSPNPGGVTGGLQMVTEKIVAPLAQIPMEGAAKGAASGILEAAQIKKLS